MEVGECSGTKRGDVWAKLVPLDSNFSDVEVRSNEVVVCSETSCSSSEKQNWCIIRRYDLISATLYNTSSSALLVDEVVLRTEESTVIKCGSIIIAGPDTKGFLKYSFKVMETVENSGSILKIPLDVEHTKCSICLNVWHDVVTVAPCLHNFCNGCFSEWLRQSQEKQKKVFCPQCRAILHSVGRNHFLRNVEEGVLQSAPGLKRSNEEYAVLDGYASIKSHIVISDAGRNSARKRQLSPPSSETLDVELQCRQCEVAIGGFRCNRTTVHLQCHTCGGMMPSRPDISISQHCSGCDRVFCAAYWRAFSVAPSGSNGVCVWNTFRPIEERTINRIPDSAHQNNIYEQDITSRCIQKTGKTLPEVISDWFMKFINKEIDQTRLPLNHVEAISSQTHLCNDCYEKLVDYLLYWFRISITRHLLPPDAAGRENCCPLPGFVYGNPFGASDTIVRLVVFFFGFFKDFGFKNRTMSSSYLPATTDSLVQALEAKGPNESISLLYRILENPSSSSEALRIKEQAISNLSELLRQEKKAEELRNLLTQLRPFFSLIPKAKTAKIVRSIIDGVTKIPGTSSDLQISLCREMVEWTRAEKRTFLRQRVEARLASLLMENREYSEALNLISNLVREVRRLDDKLLLVDINLLESKLHFSLRNLPKAKSALTAARTAANAIYVPPAQQGTIDLQSGILHAEEKDYKTGYSYFFEAFEAFNALEDPRAVFSLKYMLLCKIMVNQADDVAGIISSKAGLLYVGPELDAMKAVADAHSKRSLKLFESALRNYKAQLEEDPIVHRHLSALYDTLLDQNLCRLIEPFSRVEISHIASLIDLSVDHVEKKLSQMILDKKFAGTLDQGAGCLVIYDDPKQDVIYPAVLDTVSNMGKVVDSLYVRSARIMA
ncbi:hypothetical protein H6P81_015465 [Aristolochia fimbriata]|uniref:Uncharacterized protein n=1 Tax=Aristolochia fimbriata TaxID=158543 RepID=A0AAV7E5L2_ARIFI|nr:hypothetical protein H6P81_015465 [Aristolochia fimbriata]